MSAAGPPTRRLLDASSPHRPPPSYVIEAREVWKRYGSTDVLQGISLGVHHGDVKAILGPSGSGKSTLLRCLALLEPIDRGEVRLEGARVGVRERSGRLVPLPERHAGRASDPTSAWSSSASTCSRTSRRWAT